LTKGELSKPNPYECLSCHENHTTHRMHPIIESYDLWPGFYGSVGDSMIFNDTPEDKHFRNFLDSLRTNPDRRYRFVNADHLSTQVGGAVGGSYVPYGEDSVTNLTLRLHAMNHESLIAEWRKHPNYSKYKYALLGAVMACPSVSDFFPDGGPKGVARAQ